MSHLTHTALSPFELLDLPDGRCYVARPAETAATLIAGSFAPLEAPASAERNPVGIYRSRDEAELAIQRAGLGDQHPLPFFAAWLGK